MAKSNALARAVKDQVDVLTRWAQTEYGSDHDRERTDARKAAALDAFGRLLDLNLEPTRADLATVQGEFPSIKPLLRDLIRRRIGATNWAAWLNAEAAEKRARRRARQTIEAPEFEPQNAPDWSEGATVSELARALGCSPQNVRKAIERLRQRGKLDAQAEKKTRGVWPPEHAQEIWKDLLRNVRAKKP